MISISTIRTYMFCPLKLYFQKNLDEEIKENFTVSKTIKELRVDIQDIIQRNMRHVKKDMTVDDIKGKLSRQVDNYIETNFTMLEEDEELAGENEKIKELKEEFIEEIYLTLQILSIKVKQAMNSYKKDGNEISEIFFPNCMYNYLIRDMSLDLAGIIDKIEVVKGNYFPICLKSNNSPMKGVWDGDLIEIAACALLIEGEFDTKVLVGFIDYMKINERRAVAIDMDLRKTFFRVLNEINKIEKGEIPKVKTHLKKCENCEYRELCEKNT